MQIAKNIIPGPKRAAIGFDDNSLGFGDIYADHMFMMDYWTPDGWLNPRIVPYGNISLSPAAMSLHYGQLFFEGLKAYRWANGQIALFRPADNFKRFNRSARALCIPEVDENFALKALKELVAVDARWVPSSPGTSLYIRPFVVATEPHLGVRPSREYIFFIITSPVGPYYKEGFNPVKIYVEPHHTRAARGGLGETKASANYAASLYATEQASRKGFAQLLWLDAAEHKYIEEVGSMNIFFVVDDEVITPALTGSILAGITRDSVLKLIGQSDWGYRISERPLALAEVIQAHREGRLKEAFGTGTAAVISPVGALSYLDQTITVGDGKTGPLTQRLYDELTGIQGGLRPDPFGWVEIVPH